MPAVLGFALYTSFLFTVAFNVSKSAPWFNCKMQQIKNNAPVYVISYPLS